MVTTLAKTLATRQRLAPLAIVGFDPGNATTLLADGAQLAQIPSYVGTGNLSDLLASQGGAGGASALRPGEYAVETGGATWFVGDLALRQSADATTARGDAGRYISGHTLRLLMAAVGACYGCDMRVRLVTGVPVAILKEQPELKTTIPASLAGEWHYTFHDSEGSRALMLTVEAVVVVMEGLAALGTHGERGKPVGVIDIGGGSTDIAVMGADGRVLDNRTASLPVGVGRVGELLSQQFRADYGRHLTSAEIDAVLAAYLASTDATVYHRGARTITTEQVRRAVHQVEAQIDSFLAQRWAVGQDGSVGADLAFVVNIGGGARFFAPHIDTELRTLDVPERANVEAYAALAQRLTELGRWPQ